jgi:hypothetical protein
MLRNDVFPLPHSSVDIVGHLLSEPSTVQSIVGEVFDRSVFAQPHFVTPFTAGTAHTLRER